MVKFIVDAMLGNLARWLRFLGFDTAYSSMFTDEEILKIAREQSRVIITCDKHLFYKALKHGLRAHLVKIGSPVEVILAGLAKTYGFKLEFNPKNTRCPLCNTILAMVNDPSILRTTWYPPIKAKVYWVCRNCGQIYWRGKHFINIERKLREAKRILKLKEESLK